MDDKEISHSANAEGSSSSFSTDSLDEEERCEKKKLSTDCIEVDQIAQRSDNVPFLNIPPSPPLSATLDQIMQASDYFNKMSLAHEIAVNNDFVLKKQLPTASLENQTTLLLHKAFWDVFQEELDETPPNYSQALALLEEIKEALMNVILPHQEVMKKYINGKLDLNLVRQQIENNALDIQEYADFIISTMAKLCAPIRDENIQNLRSVKEIVPLYKGILETLSLMKIDLANYTIKTIRPHIQQVSAEYEKQKFKEFLNSLASMTPPVDGLELTKIWLTKVYAKLKESFPPSKKITGSELIAKAFVEVLLWDEDVVFPETLQMDKARYLTLRKEFFTIVITASVLLLTYSTVGESIHGIESLKLKLKDQLSVLLKNSSADIRSEENLREYLQNIEVQVIKEVNSCLLAHGFPELCESKKFLLSSQIHRVSSAEHNIRKIITSRILEFLVNIVGFAKVASTAVRFPLGLSAFHKEIQNIGGTFLRLVNHNQAVFNDYYADIMASIIESD